MLRDDLPYVVLPLRVVHPGQRDVWGKLVALRVDADARRLGLDGLVEPPEFVAAPLDAEPHHGNVLERGEHPQSAIGHLERLDTGAPDAALDCAVDRLPFPLGDVADGYPTADLVRVAPNDEFDPVSTIRRASPRRVVGQYTKLGLADLMARGEELTKVGSFSDRSSGGIEGINGVTCYTGRSCKSGQLKWGTQGDVVDGDSGSVNYHVDPENPDDGVLVGGLNNARTWWPGVDFSWGTAAHHLLEEYGLHF